MIGAIMFFRTSRRDIPLEIYRHLNTALEGTIKEIPFLGGNVVPVDDEVGHYEVRGPSPDTPKREPLIFNDMTSGSSTPWKHTFKSLSKLKFPVALMDQDMLSPVTEYTGLAEPPVHAAQANFIDGGLILFTSVIHTACDALAWYNIVSVWASKFKAAYDPDAGSITVTPAMLDRSPLQKGSKNVQRSDVREFKLQALNANKTSADTILFDARPTSASGMQMGIFSISKSRFAALRDAVQKSDDSEVWVTPNDALSAFLWDRLNYVRFDKSINETGSTSGSEPLTANLAMAIDGRLKLEPALPMMFMGNSALAFPITLPVHPKSTGALAAEIRTAMEEFHDQHMKDVIGYLSSIGDATTERVQYARSINPTLVISVLKDMPFASLDWGSGLGIWELCRPLRPFVDNIPRAIPYLTHRNGDVEVMVWIEEVAMKRLKMDAEWKKFMSFVCN